MKVEWSGCLGYFLRVSGGAINISVRRWMDCPSKLVTEGIWMGHQNWLPRMVGRAIKIGVRG